MEKTNWEEFKKEHIPGYNQLTDEKDKLNALKDNLNILSDYLKPERDKAVLWTGNVPVLEDKGVVKGVLSGDYAQQTAYLNGFDTLEKKMEDTFDKFDDGLRKDFDELSNDPNTASDFWKDISDIYSSGIEGDAYAFEGADNRTDSIFRKQELPNVLNNPNVDSLTLINVQTRDISSLKGDKKIIDNLVLPNEGTLHDIKIKKDVQIDDREDTTETSKDKVDIRNIGDSDELIKNTNNEDYKYSQNNATYGDSIDDFKDGNNVAAVGVTELYEEDGKQKSDDRNQYTITDDPSVKADFEKAPEEFEGEEEVHFQRDDSGELKKVLDIDGQPKETDAKDEEPKDEEPQDEEPKDEEPKDKEPKDEESQDEEPKDEEPKDEEPKDKEPKDEEPKDEEPKDVDPKDEEPKDEEPKDEEPQDEEPKEQTFFKGIDYSDIDDDGADNDETKDDRKDGEKTKLNEIDREDLDDDKTDTDNDKTDKSDTTDNPQSEKSDKQDFEDDHSDNDKPDNQQENFPDNEPDSPETGDGGDNGDGRIR